MKRIFAIALLMAGAALLSGCPKKHNVIEPPSAGSQVSGSTTQGDEGASTSSRALHGDANAQGANGMGADRKKHNVIEPPRAGSQVSGSTTQGDEGASTSSRALNGDANAQGANGMGADDTG